MLRTSFSLFCAGLLAMTLGQAALAQMQLAREVADQLAALGIDETLVLSEEQLLQVEAALNTNDSDESKKAAITKILSN